MSQNEKAEMVPVTMAKPIAAGGNLQSPAQAAHRLQPPHDAVGEGG